MHPTQRREDNILEKHNTVNTEKKQQQCKILYWEIECSYCIDGNVYHVWQLLIHAWNIDLLLLFEICVFIKMVKLFEYKYFKIISHYSLVCLMVFNATFNNISVISWRSVLLVEETREPVENHCPVTDKLYHIMLYTLPWSRFKLTTSVVIGTDCIGSCKSNYHMITATTAPVLFVPLAHPSLVRHIFFSSLQFLTLLLVTSWILQRYPCDNTCQIQNHNKIRLWKFENR